MSSILDCVRPDTLSALSVLILTPFPNTHQALDPTLLLQLLIEGRSSTFDHNGIARMEMKGQNSVTMTYTAVHSQVLQAEGLGKIQSSA
jgi:hypothetical protein